MVKGLVMVKESDLKKADKRALATLYLYWLENGKKNTFDLPLFVDDNGKGVMSMESFKRVFYAFLEKSKSVYTCDIKSGNDGDSTSYNVVRLTKSNDVKIDDVNFTSNFEEPKKTDVKRESSKKTAEKSEAKKKETEKKESEANAEWNSKATKRLVDLFVGYGLKLDADKMTSLEKAIKTILETTL